MINWSKKPVKVAAQPRPAKKKKSKPQVVEMTRLGGALRALGGLGGSALGGLIGMGDAGSKFGTGLGASLSRWLGSGDYSVSSNSIVRQSASGTIPAMHRDGQTIVVRHKEFLTEIRGAQNFTVRNEFDLNPGLSTTFPWLSAVAAQYSQYKIRGLVYHYIPTSGNAISGTNAALGSVMIQTSYRATETAPTSKIEMLNEYWSSEAKPSEEFCHPIECDPKENPFNVQYIRTGELPTTENQLMYDLGRTTIAVSGQQADDTMLGDLWVTYEIELKKPVLTSLNNMSLAGFAGTSNTSVGSGNPFGAVGTFTTSFNTLPTTVSIGPTALTFNRGIVGSFQLTCYWQGCTAFNSAVFAISGTGSSIFNAVANSASIGTDYTTGTGQAMATCYFTITNPDTTTILSITATTINGSPRCRLVVTEVNPLLRVNT